MTRVNPKIVLVAVQTALNIGELVASGQVDNLKQDLERVAQDLKALAARDDGSIPTDEEFRQMIADAKTGFQSAIDDGGPGA